MNVRLRHDAIVRSLRRNGTSTVDELAEEVGASRRTVLRDIGALRDEGYVIHSEVGRGGGLQLDPQSDSYSSWPGHRSRRTAASCSCSNSLACRRSASSAICS
jgi:predicted DNA-binding transcriptional regulator YafY